MDLITWKKTERQKYYPYLLEDYYLEVDGGFENSFHLIGVSIEHPKTWNRDTHEFDIDFETKIIHVNDRVFPYENVSEAEAYIDELISEYQIKFVDGLATATTNNPLIKK